MKIIDKVWVFDYLMEIFMIMTMVCGQSLLTNSLNSLGYISIHISFIIYCLFYFLPILYFIALWNSDAIDYRKNIILLIILFIFNKLFHGNQVQLSFPLPAIDFYEVDLSLKQKVVCMLVTTRNQQYSFECKQDARFLQIIDLFEQKKIRYIDRSHFISIKR